MYQRTYYCSSAVRGPGPKAWAVQRALSQIKNPPADYKITKALIALGNGHFRNFLCHSAACASLAASTATAARGYLACQPAWHQQYPSMLLPYGQCHTAAPKGGLQRKHLCTPHCQAPAGGIRPDNPAYSHGVRQQLWHMFGNGSNPQVLIHSGGMHPDEYARMLNTSKFCLAPSGYGWGIRLNFYMASGCVPVIVQVSSDFD